MAPIALSEEWVLVFSGPAARAQLLRDELEEAGILTFAPDSNLRRLSPGDMGGIDVFDDKVLVPRHQLARARDVLQPPQQGDIEWELGPTDIEPRPDGPTKRLERLGQRVRWCAVFAPLSPLGLWLAVEYLIKARGTRRRPLDHGWTMFAAAVCALETLLLLWMTRLR
jgi:hypothetical protein